MKIAYVTDSGTGRTISELAADGIISIPLQIMDGTTTYQDMETLDRNACLDLVEHGHVLKTSQPNPGLIEECFEDLKDQGTDLIVAVPICNGLSGTISTMTAIARDLDLRIICIDTYVTSEVQYYLIKRIKAMYEEGKSDLEIKLAVDAVIDSCNTLIMPRSLDALVRGGRLTPMAAGFAKLLKIVPILKINKSTSGRIDSVANVRTYRKAVARVIDDIHNDHPGEGWKMFIAHAGAVDAAMDLYHRFEEEFPGVDIQVTELVNPVAAHTGADCICIQYFKTV
ncbi:MAG: DegV family protein [Erysipelotrichaceae bacterium]|nr:DegV family protein [Erysipelotrichaceae bacterium]